MVASCGVSVAKMSGRGLGHTGGTIDKLESFKGFSTSITNEQFIDNVNRIGISIMGQTKDLAPADKLLYALRDVTATVDNMSLIASSIMSKKLAAGADGIVLDVKSGSGAFMKTDEDAFELANKMVGITDRETATNAQLNDLSTMERLITKVVIDGMNEGLNYKDIYKNSKERLETVYGWLPKEVGA
jgi:thymidine phosphorylase